MAAKKAAKKSAKSARAKKKAPAKARKAAPRKSAAGIPVARIDRRVAELHGERPGEEHSRGTATSSASTLEESWKDDAGNVMGVSLKAGDVSFMIGQDDWKKGRDRQKGEGFRIFCMTKASVDDLAKKIEAKGGRLDHPPTDQPWGVRDISLTDPDGFKITIAVAKR